MKVEVSLPQQDLIDWDAPCYAVISIWMHKVCIRGIGRTEAEAKADAISRLKGNNEEYRRRMTKYINECSMYNPVGDRFHSWVKLAIAECDMALYLYYNRGGFGDKFIFERAYVPYKLKHMS